MSDSNTEVSSIVSSEVVKNYVACFVARLETIRVWKELQVRCKRRAGDKLMSAFNGIGNCDADADSEDEAGEMFIAFVKTDESAADFVARMHSKSLAAFDQIKSALAGEVKEAGRKLLVAQYAQYQSHRQLLKAAILTKGAVLDELTQDSTFEKLLHRPGAFSIHEELSFSPLWEEIFPQA